MTATISVRTIGKLENVKDPAVLLAGHVKSIARSDLPRTDVVRIGNDLYNAKAKLRPRNSTCQRNRPRCHPTTAMSGIRPVGKVRGAVTERSEFTASEKFTVGDAAHGEGEPSAGHALLLPSSDGPLGVLE